MVPQKREKQGPHSSDPPNHLHKSTYFQFPNRQFKQLPSLRLIPIAPILNCAFNQFMSPSEKSNCLQLQRQQSILNSRLNCLCDGQTSNPSSRNNLLKQGQASYKIKMQYLPNSQLTQQNLQAHFNAQRAVENNAWMHRDPSQNGNWNGQQDYRGSTISEKQFQPGSGIYLSESNPVQDFRNKFESPMFGGGPGFDQRMQQMQERSNIIDQNQQRGQFYDPRKFNPEQQYTDPVDQQLRNTYNQGFGNAWQPVGNYNPNVAPFQNNQQPRSNLQQQQMQQMQQNEHQQQYQQNNQGHRHPIFQNRSFQNNNLKPQTARTPEKHQQQRMSNHDNPHRNSAVGGGTAPSKSILTPRRNRGKSLGPKKVKFADEV